MYLLLKSLFRIFYFIYYKIAIKGIENIPNNKAIIFAPNHVNGFIDPITVAIIIPMKVRFFARGDVFKGRLVKWALNSINISPMYRMQEGYSEVKKNDKSFEECRNLLANNKALLLFPEAICVQQKKLQPLKKGLARILFQTEELFDFKKDVLVVPVGLNYSDPKNFGSKLFVNFGSAISISNFEKDYRQDKVRTINDFTKHLEQEMKKLIITVNNTENEELLQGIIEICLDQWMDEKNYKLKNLEKQFIVSKEIAEMINFIAFENPNAIESLKKLIFPYIKDLENLKLQDNLLRPETINKMNPQKHFLDFFITCLGMPIYIIGLAVNYPPYYVSKNFTNKKVKKAEFFASIYLNMSMFLWLLYYVIQLFFVAFLFRSTIGLVSFAIFTPITGLFLLRFHSKMMQTFGGWRLFRLVLKEKKKIEQLIKVRMQIIIEIDFAKEKYRRGIKNKFSE